MAKLTPYTATAGTYRYKDLLAQTGFRFDASPNAKVWRHPGLTAEALADLKRRTSRSLVLVPTVKSCKPEDRNEKGPAR